jgi:carboxypeptidase C (cathepsin A)
LFSRFYFFYLYFSESYAGHYIPALAGFIFDQNAQGSNPHINLQAVAIGNGLVDPLLQVSNKKKNKS